MHYVGSSIIKNGSIELAEEQTPIGLDDEIYEVILVEDGKPLFLGDHLKRWHDSMHRRKATLPKWTEKMAALIDWLTVCNGVSKGSLRITASADGTIQCGFEEKVFPDKSVYSEGIACGLIDAIREDPSTKAYHAAMRNAVAKQQKESGEFETLLVNPADEITEGSCTNVFFVSKEGEIVTAPDDMVLHGIIREKILTVCKEKGIAVRMSCVNRDKIGDYSAAFVSNTPWRIVPIKTLGDVKYETGNAVLKNIMDGVENLVKMQKDKRQ